MPCRSVCSPPADDDDGENDDGCCHGSYDTRDDGDGAEDDDNYLTCLKSKKTRR